MKKCRQIDKSKLCVHGFPVFPQPIADFRFKIFFCSQNKNNNGSKKKRENKVKFKDLMNQTQKKI